MDEVKNKTVNQIMTSQYKLMKFPPLSDRVVPNPVVPLRHDAVSVHIPLKVTEKKYFEKYNYNN